MTNYYVRFEVDASGGQPAGPAYFKGEVTSAAGAHPIRVRFVDGKRKSFGLDQVGVVDDSGSAEILDEAGFVAFQAAGPAQAQAAVCPHCGEVGHEAWDCRQQSLANPHSGGGRQRPRRSAKVSRQRVRGSRAQVMNGSAMKTPGGLKKKDLKYNRQGRIVSRKKSQKAKRENRLVKSGYVTEKGKFGSIFVGEEGKKKSKKRSPKKRSPKKKSKKRSSKKR